MSEKKILLLKSNLSGKTSKYTVSNRSLGRRTRKEFFCLGYVAISPNHLVSVVFEVTFS